MHAAQSRLDELTKPPGSLGRLESLAVHLAGMTGQPLPTFPRKAIILLAADHGVAQEGVSAYPQAVTAQMVSNFLGGGAAINVLARQAGARVVVADFGVASDLPAHPEMLSRKLAAGTGNIAVGPAMSPEQALAAIGAGADIVGNECQTGLDLVATGDMGIANTTPSSAIVAVMTGRPVASVTGRGTGIDEATWQHKIATIEQAIRVNEPDPHEPMDVLSRLGGFEIAGLAGVMLAAAAERVPVMIDGLVSGAAALIAVALDPALKDYLIAGHCSAEPGHAAALDHLRLEPLLSLGMRLGEGTGAVLAMHLVDAAAAIIGKMSTFTEASVSKRDAV
jgi:nicotinate-nucleotide--dimethylbenzimidazole phosphoribosyltransferase